MSRAEKISQPLAADDVDASNSLLTANFATPITVSQSHPQRTQPRFPVPPRNSERLSIQAVPRAENAVRILRHGEWNEVGPSDPSHGRWESHGCLYLSQAGTAQRQVLASRHGPGRGASVAHCASSHTATVRSSALFSRYGFARPDPRLNHSSRYDSPLCCAVAVAAADTSPRVSPRQRWRRGSGTSRGNWHNNREVLGSVVNHLGAGVPAAGAPRRFPAQIVPAVVGNFILRIHPHPAMRGTCHVQVAGQHVKSGPRA